MENDDAEADRTEPGQPDEVTPILLDVDTGTDDALALLYAVAHPRLRLLGVSCVAGNASLERVVDNTARVLDAAAAPAVPIAAGAAKPLIERMRPQGHFHGEDGLGGSSCRLRGGRWRRSRRWGCCTSRSPLRRSR